MKKKIHKTADTPGDSDVSGRVKNTVSFIRSKTALRPKIAIILGSGLGDFTATLTQRTTLDVMSIPHYPQLTVQGHRGTLVFGKSDGINLLAFQGRAHFYEGGVLETVLYPIHVANALGIRILIITNAAGGVNENFRAGDLMMITDQINLTFEKPLAGIRRPILGSSLYDMRLQNIIVDAANEHRIPIQRGVYCGVKGPSYETAAEIGMVRRLGGDAVGMSTVNEVSRAAALGMQIGGISCITNLATGITNGKLSHAEVTEVANNVKEKFSQLIKAVIRRIG